MLLASPRLLVAVDRRTLYGHGRRRLLWSCRERCVGGAIAVVPHFNCWLAMGIHVLREDSTSRHSKPVPVAGHARSRSYVSPSHRPQ